MIVFIKSTYLKLHITIATTPLRLDETISKYLCTSLHGTCVYICNISTYFEGKSNNSDQKKKKKSQEKIQTQRNYFCVHGVPPETLLLADFY